MKYKGMAHDEYALYETEDNGRNWQFVGDAPINAAQTYDRIIYGSTENKGLRYSDDNGVTILPSDHPTGNWDGINYKDNKVFAHSMDGEGIFYSQETEENGIGEVWHKIYDSPGGDVVEVVDGNYQTDTMVITPEGPISNAKIENGKIVSKPLDFYNGVLTVVLNKLVMPQLVLRLTGSADPKVLAEFNDGITWGNTSYSNFFSEKQLYHTKASYGNHMSKDDFRYTVGMTPIILKTEDFIEEVDTTNIPLSEGIKLPENDTLKKTLNLIDTILNIKREEAVENMANEINSVPTESDNLLDLDLTDEEYANALYMQKMFYDVQKSSVVSVVSTMLNAIYTFDTQRKIALLKAAIYETAIKVAPSIQYQLKQIEKKIGNSDFAITDKDLDIKYDFALGLQTAMTNYLNTVYKNLALILEEPENLKEHAASWYKDFFRESALNELEAFMSTVSIPYNTDSINSVITNIKSLNTKIINYYNARDNFLISLKDIQNAPKDEIIETLSNLNFNDGLEIVRNNDVNTAINKIEALEYDYKEELSNILNNSSADNFIKSIYQNLYDKLKEELDTIYYDDYYDIDDDYGEDINFSVLQGLEKEILEEFKNRCLELLELIYTNMIKNVGEDYYTDYIFSELENYIQLQDGSYNKDIENVLKRTHKNVLGLLKTSWIRMKETI